MKTPDWWTSLLLFAAAFRIYRLLAKDTILDMARSKLIGLGKWGPGMPIPDGYRERWAEFIVCPWCLGFWICLGWWGAWYQWPTTITAVSVPLALSAAVGLAAKLDQDD
jgi:hypothetical protein